MPEYRRYFQPGGTYFFTLVTAGRAPVFRSEWVVRVLHEQLVLTRQRWPFDLQALVVLPDHLHTIWILPEDDQDFSKRIGFLKKEFTKSFLERGGLERWVSPSKRSDRRSGVWQRRFMEHLIRDELDFERHCDYLCYNPVTHGHAACPHQWHASTFAEAVKKGQYDMDWLCVCERRTVQVPMFDDINHDLIE